MPNDQAITPLYCPSCGGSVSIEGARGTCPYCGTTIERPGAVAAAAPPPPIQQVTWTVQRPQVIAAPPVRRRSSCLGALFPLIIFLVIAFAVGQGVTRGLLLTQVMNLLRGGTGGLTSTIAQVSLGPITRLATVIPRDGAGGDLLVYAYGVGDGRYTLAMIDGRTRAVRWKSDSLSKNAYQGLLVAGRDMVYLTDEANLVALRLRDGTAAWRASLVVEPPAGCDDCLRLVGSRVVVLQKDGSLQGFDAQSGKQTWSTRLDGTPRSLPVAGDKLVVMRQPDDKQGMRIAFIDATSGDATRQIDPHCPSVTESFGEERPRADTPLLFSHDGSALYLIFGFFKKCAQRWDVGGDQPRWQVPIDDQLAPPIWTDNLPVLTDNAIYLSNQGKIWALGAGDGAVRPLVDEKDYKLVPLGLSDGVLIALASPTWDSRRLALWGLDAATGERRWQAALDAHEMRRLGSFGDWDWRLTPKGLVVAQVLRDQAQLIVETINPSTGVIANRQATDLAGAHLPSLQNALWTDDMAWLKVDNTIYAVDLATSKPAYHLP